MALQAFVGNFALNTTTGNQAIAGVGFQPKIVFFISMRGNAAGGGTDFRNMMGVAVSSTQRAGWYTFIGDGAAVSNGFRAFKTNRCFVGGGSAISCEVDFVSMDSDGFTINVVTPDGTNARQIAFLALGVEELEAKVGTFNVNTTTGNQAVTGAGFRPDGVLLFYVLSNTTEGQTTDAMFGHGWGISSAKRWANTFFGVDAADPSDQQRAYDEAACLLRVSASAIDVEADFVSNDPDGFTINLSTAPASTFTAVYVALKGAVLSTVAITQPTATGSQAVTGAGFAPLALMLASSGGVAADNGAFSAHAEHCYGLAAGASQEAALCGRADDALATSDASRGLSVTACLRFQSAANVLLAEADLTSFDADGFTLNWSTVNATARRIAALALGSQDPLLLLRSRGREEPVIRTNRIEEALATS